MEFGIDVAKWQGTIDWSKVKVSFAILKVTKQNNSVEESFERNYSGATNAGIKVGGYRYVYAKTVAEAKKEAEALVKIIKGKNLPYGIWLDMEDKSIRGIGKANLSAIIKAEADIIKAAGYKVGIYCNKDWYNNVLDGRGLSNEYPFWIARYPSVDTGKFNESSTLNPKSYAVAWQYSSKGKVSGIKGNVDMDVFFVDGYGTTQKEEKPTASNVPTRVLQKGCKGEDVKWLQTTLNNKGFNCGKVDGDFGEKTRTAVKAYQKSVGLTPDGIVGAKTLYKLTH